jgi:hypothetical protein
LLLNTIEFLSQVDLKAIEEQSKQAALIEEMVPEGALRFDIAPEVLQAVLSDTR